MFKVFASAEAVTLVQGFGLAVWVVGFAEPSLGAPRGVRRGGGASGGSPPRHLSAARSSRAGPGAPGTGFVCFCGVISGRAAGASMCAVIPHMVLLAIDNKT